MTWQPTPRQDCLCPVGTHTGECLRFLVRLAVRAHRETARELRRCAPRTGALRRSLEGGRRA